ncbi:hypothetical protein OO256_28690 [Pseudomonas sp. DCB_CB]|uniref:hypothetical protein n=1 Tax=unclassified Pseudomonas TaxID=196821 RepID=UPI002249A015|nr:MULTISPECIES: hypothetical protein [unclassified Pseudomonas]MCX2694984.1 hypothetical protein [Pseudomonas sp. DCB_BZ]MCX2860057.1 hypothetical protein [Pseudomonas sp. DCB_CB]
MSQEITRKFVPVAEFRRQCDALYRQVNVHYHSCVFAAEVARWVDAAEQQIADLEAIDSKRAKPEDREYHARALQAARERVSSAGARIGRLRLEEAFRQRGSVMPENPPRTEPEQLTPRPRPALRLVVSH